MKELKNQDRKSVALKDSFQFKETVPTDRKKDRECFYLLCPLFFASTAFVDTNAYSEIFCSAKCEIMFCRTL